MYAYVKTQDLCISLYINVAYIGKNVNKSNRMCDDVFGVRVYWFLQFTLKCINTDRKMNRLIDKCSRKLMVGSRKHLDQGDIGTHCKITSTFLYAGNISK